MQTSNSTNYALLAVAYVAKHKNEGAILSQAVSKEYDIPLLYLLKIMQFLVRANILTSKRGPRGGFSMAKPIQNITFLEIIEAVEGPIGKTLDLTSYASLGEFGVNAGRVYAEVMSRARNAFNEIKLSDLIPMADLSQGISESATSRPTSDTIPSVSPPQVVTKSTIPTTCESGVPWEVLKAKIAKAFGV